MMQQRSTELGSAVDIICLCLLIGQIKMFACLLVDSRHHLTNFKMLVSQSV